MHDQQVAVVTGASSGIGRAIALAIAATGASVCLVGRNHDRLAAVAAVARKTACSVMVHEADLTSDSAVENLTRSIKEDFKTVDILVHCAGAYAKGELESTPVEQLDALYRANVRMPYAVTQALLPFLKIRQGQIVFVNSSQGLNAGRATGVFSATQHALKAITDSLRQEVNADGIRVISVYPGRTATPRMKALYQTEGWDYQPELLLQAEDIAKMVSQALFLPRTAEVTSLEIRPLTRSY
jgi:NADP-dependent 3-hydroxy acid dehydrogenase YdfG